MNDNSERLPAESWRTRLMRYRFNVFPAFRRTGARVTHLSADERHIRIRLPLNLNTKNYVGTLYGGCMYAAVDPFYMVMFIRLLGKDYVVWDMSGRIEHLKPGRSALTAEFHISDEDLQLVRDELALHGKLVRDYVIELVDEHQEIHARITKTLYFSKKKKTATE